MSEYQNFRDAVAGSDALKTRWNAVADAAIESAAREGIVMTRADCMSLDSIRLHVLTGDEELGVNWREEAVQKLPAFAQKDQSKRFLDALKSENESEKRTAELEMMRKNPAERMRIAREGGEAFSGPIGTKRDLAPEERAKIISELDRVGLKGSARIQKARELGLE